MTRLERFRFLSKGTVKIIIQCADAIPSQNNFKLFFRALDEENRPISDAKFEIYVYNEYGIYSYIAECNHVGYGTYFAEIPDLPQYGLIVINALLQYSASKAVEIYAAPQSGGTPEEISLIRKILTNRWKISENKLTIYDDDQQTPLLIFELYDKEGNPTEIAVFERVPQQ